MVKRVLSGLLLLACLGFFLDWLHMTIHLVKDPQLWKIEGVALKFLLKTFWLLLPLILLFRPKLWIRFLPGLILMLLIPSSARADFFPSACKEARQMLDGSGVARDADENFFGKIKVQSPQGSFPQEMDKITWWGKFKPFEFWQSPAFQASWIDPEGKEVARQEFQGMKCALAKTGLRGDSQPRGEFKPGMWKIIVTCQDYVIDNQSFAVLPSAPLATPKQESSAKKEQPIMIWAKDKV